MSNFEEILGLDATAQAALIHRKEIKPLELVEAAIERVEKVNPFEFPLRAAARSA